MYDSSSSSNSSNNPGHEELMLQSTTRLLRGMLYAALVAAIAVVAVFGYKAIEDKSAMRKSQDEIVSWHGLVAPTSKHLASEFTDKSGRLLADPPSDPEKLLDPETIVVAHYQDSDKATQIVDWGDFQAFLTKATGKKAVLQEYQNSADDIAAIKQGKTQVVALHAADAPYIVNNAGFIPVAVLASESAAHGNRLDLAVRTSSDIKTLADIKGHTLTCSAPDSITGYRAAVALLAQEASLRPSVDYNIAFSFGQKRSVLGIASGEFEVAALSDDKLQSLLKLGDVKEANYRVIYHSEVIPRLTIGYVYNLRPELADKIAKAILEFKNEKGDTEDSAGAPLHFITTDYKKDFELVRRIDDSFDPRFAKSPKGKRDSSG
ncbi:MAG TPA: PhnD/SsuA/transferrin family substrate-binding protein [Pirellulales bacterium]|nr:PhnD/SsuA/transferrin family substrate-binding protein [Pirellulales bacterium]